MPRWAQGAAEIERLLAARHLQRVTTTPEAVAALLEAATRHVDLARSGSTRDLEGAYSLAYDAARKCATALLGHQGLRPTTTGGHIAVAEAVRAQSQASPA